MYPDIITIGILIMVACVGVEFGLDLWRRPGNYRLDAAVSNMTCGAFEQVTGFISKGRFVALYLCPYPLRALVAPEMRTLGLVFNTPYHHQLYHRCKDESNE